MIAMMHGQFATPASIVGGVGGVGGVVVVLMNGVSMAAARHVPVIDS